MTATCTDCSNNGSVLFLALELGWCKWHLAFGSVAGGMILRRTIDARDLAGLDREIRRARRHFGLAPSGSVVSCYEAGRDGFWLARYLRDAGIRNLVVDSSSIEVDRRARRSKTDRLDGGKLLKKLMRYESGERDTWSVVHVPGIDDEDRRQLHRELRILRKDRTRHSNRIKGWLAGCGLSVEVDEKLPETLGELRQWNGSAVPLNLRRRIEREYARLHLVDEQIREMATDDC